MLGLAVACGVNAQTAPPSAATERASAPAISRTVGLDHFAAGGQVRIHQPVSGDLIAAAGALDVDATVAGNAMVTGGTVRLGAGVGRSVIAAAGRLSVHGPVGHNLRVAGGHVELLPEASVAGNVSVGAGQVTLRGPVQGDVRVAGGTVLIDTSVQGDVWVGAGQVRLGPNAKLAGALHWRGNQAMERDPAAQVAGAVSAITWPTTRGHGGPGGHEGHDNDKMPHRSDTKSWHTPSSFTGGWWWTLGLMLLSAGLVAALPGTAQRVTLTLRNRWPWSVLAGLAVIACVPVAAVLLLITVVGAPVALVLLLMYVPLLIVGYASLGAALGQWALASWQAQHVASTSWRVAAAMLGMLVLAALASLPWLGPLVAVLAVLSGVGLLALQLVR
jgi:cytoskeletal protein CcmA (bactofilin family)